MTVQTPMKSLNLGKLIKTLQKSKKVENTKRALAYYNIDKVLPQNFTESVTYGTQKLNHTVK